MKCRIKNFLIPFATVLFAFGIGTTVIPEKNPRFCLPKSEVIFSPNGHTREQIKTVLDLATRDIEIAAYCFNSEYIAEVLEDAARRGVAVRLISDRYNAKRAGKLFNEMRLAGVEILFDRRHAIFHSKYIIIDGHALICGSYNWTNSAEFNNAEFCLFMEDPNLCQKFNRDFTGHWLHSVEK